MENGNYYGILGFYLAYIRVLPIGVILGLYRDNGKDNGSCTNEINEIAQPSLHLKTVSQTSHKSRPCTRKLVGFVLNRRIC